MGERLSHRPDHWSLLRLVRDQPGPSHVVTGSRATPAVDAVVVPAARSAGLLGDVARLAASGNWPLVVLCSRAVRAEDVLASLDSSRAGQFVSPVVAVDLDPAAHPVGTRLPIADLPTCGEDGYGDVAAKRNLSLLVARRLGWSRLLFVDDDIRGLTPASVVATAGELDRSRLVVAGWLATGYPDNSAVCHANRLSGGTQGSFIGAGALLVRVDGRVPFFPPVYNEDWLFCFHALSAQAVGLAGAARQLPSDPFATPERARCEEFGDVLGEGLFEILHRRLSLRAASAPSFWSAVIDARYALLRTVTERLRGRSTPEALALDGVRRDAMLASLTAARRR